MCTSSHSPKEQFMVEQTTSKLERTIKQDTFNEYKVILCGNELDGELFHETVKRLMEKQLIE